MSDQGYRRQGATSTSFVAAVAINAALIALIATSAPSVFAPPDKPFEGVNIPIDPPPPPIPEKPKTEAKKPASTPISTPDSKVDVLVPRPNDIPTTDVFDPIVDPGPLDPGTGVVVDPPKPAPVLVDAAPDARAEFQPAYPPSERRAGTEGSVTVRVLIGADGRVKQVEQVRTAAAAFFEVTKRQALSRWRFRPATRDGVPVESWRTMTLRFVLEE